jgi:Mannose-1-phosphate guanylyltransferase
MHAIIPAGGAGTRLWPLSRQNHPKFLLDLTGSGKSLLQDTVLRLQKVSESVTVVTGSGHVSAVAEQLADLDVNILAEPSPRDSMAAIGYGAYVIGEKYGSDAVVGSFAADHVIEDQGGFERSIKSAIRGAELGFLTTVGITPSAPSEAFGYIEPGEEVETGIWKVKKFVEKPDVSLAKEYVSKGYVWNAGMFVARVFDIEAGLQAHLPLMDEGLRALAAKEMDESVWQRLPKIAIDYALAEPLADQGKVAVVKSAFDWSDVGDFAVLSQRAKKAGGQDGYVSSSKHVEVVGIPGAIVVETDDAILVTDVNHAQDVKDAVVRLRSLGMTHLL